MKTSQSSESSRVNFGQLGEAYAAAYLEQCGYRLVAANFTLPVGRNRLDVVITAELDLVAYDVGTLCFVEVKTRKSDWFAAPEVNVNRRKRRQVARAAHEYRRMLGLEDEPYRYDVVSVVLGENESSPSIELFKGFWREESIKHRRPDRFYD